MSKIGTTEAAKLLGISKQRLTQLVREGRVTGVSTIGNQYVFSTTLKVKPAPSGRGHWGKKE